MSSPLRSDAREIFEANQEAAWRAFRDGQPCPVVVRVPPTFVPLGANVAPQKTDHQHVIRFVPGYLGDQPAYCVMVDDTPALEDCVAPVGSLAKHVWDVHAAQFASPGPSGRGTAHPGPVPDGYVLNPNSGDLSALRAPNEFEAAFRRKIKMLSEARMPDPVEAALGLTWHDLRKLLLRWGCYLIAVVVVVHLAGWWLGWPGPVWQR